MTSKEIKKYLKDNFKKSEVQRLMTNLENIGVTFKKNTTPSSLRDHLFSKSYEIKRLSKDREGNRIRRTFSPANIWNDFRLYPDSDEAKEEEYFIGYIRAVIVVYTDIDDKNIIAAYFKKITEADVKEAKASANAYKKLIDLSLKRFGKSSSNE